MPNDELSELIQEYSCNLPIYGVYCADGENAPFADLYYDMFPEQYDVE